MGTAMKIIQDDSLRVVEGGYEVQVRLNWYRSLPLSCVEKVTLALDGKLVDSEKIRFGINGHEYKLEELDDLVEEFWFVQDSAILRVLQPGAVTKGTPSRLKLPCASRTFRWGLANSSPPLQNMPPPR
jgi:hypothetical protein